MTLFPDAVLVDTMTLLPLARALIAATWCLYKSVIFLESFRACVMLVDSGGTNMAEMNISDQAVAFKAHATDQIPLL
jgi:hypothetical protein